MIAMAAFCLGGKRHTGDECDAVLDAAMTNDGGETIDEKKEPARPKLVQQPDTFPRPV